MKIRLTPMVAGVLSAALLCGLVGCSQKGLASSDAASDSLEYQQAFEEQEPSIPKTAENKDKVAKLKLISSPGGVIYTGPAFTKDGFYEILISKDVSSGTGNIAYTDYETKTRIYLSSDVNSTHQDASDTSFLPSLTGGYGIITDQQRLYVAKLGDPYLFNYYGENGLPVLYRMQLDGSNRQQIKLASNEEIVGTSGILADSEKNELYFLMTETSEDTTTKEYLAQTDFDNGTIERVCCINDFVDGFVYAVGAEEDSIYFVKNYYDSESYISGWDFFCYSLSDNSWEKIGTLNASDSYPLYRDGQIYYIKSNPFSLYRLVPGEETDEVINANLNPPYSYDTVRVGRQSLDPFFSFYFSNQENGDSARLCWNEENGQWYMERLLRDSHNVTIAGQFNDQYVVRIEDKSVDYQAPLEDGTVRQLSMLVAQYALISKEDYWNGIPNYTLFSDTIYP